MTVLDGDPAFARDAWNALRDHVARTRLAPDGPPVAIVDVMLEGAALPRELDAEDVASVRAWLVGAYRHLGLQPGALDPLRVRGPEDEE